MSETISDNSKQGFRKKNMKQPKIKTRFLSEQARAARNIKMKTYQT